MDLIIVGLLGIFFMIVLIVLGVPIAFSMAAIGIIGTAIVAGIPQALSQPMLVSWAKGTDFLFTCIPLFIFMGQLAATTGIAAELYDFLQKWMGRLPGGLAIASVCACGGFGAVTGSSVACVATMGTIIYPELKKYNYECKLATGVLAASGTLGILIPPSLAFAFYGIITDTSIGSLFIAGIIPGIITILIYASIILFRCIRNPQLGPLGPSYSWKERLNSARGILPVAAIFIICVGSLYGGLCTPTEAAGIGAAGVIFVSLAMKKLTWKKFRAALWETCVTSAFIFAIVIGGFLISRFLVLTDISRLIIDYVQLLNPSKLVFIIFLAVLYLILGCILDVFGMLILTLPFVFPVTTSLGIHPVWFGVFVTIMTEIALITPPVGVNVFVMRSIATDVPMGQIFIGIVPFLFGEFVLIALLIIFPEIAIWLPSTMK